MSTGKSLMLFQPKRKRLIILFIVSLIITVCLGGTFIFSFFRGFVDFPCFIEVEDGILMPRGYEDYDDSSHAILFITTFYAHMSGGGCKIVELDNGGSTNLGPYQIQVNGDVLTINGAHLLNAGKEYEDVTKRMSLNPWYWYEDSFKISNHGYVIGVEAPDEEIQNLERDLLIATGSMGSREHLNLITTIIFFLTLLGTVILGPTLFIQWIKNKSKEKHANN